METESKMEVRNRLIMIQLTFWRAFLRPQDARLDYKTLHITYQTSPSAEFNLTVHLKPVKCTLWIQL